MLILLCASIHNYHANGKIIDSNRINNLTDNFAHKIRGGSPPSLTVHEAVFSS